VNTDRFIIAEEPDEYYLVVSRLIPYKRVDLAVKVFTELNLPLRIVGDGRDRIILEKMAGSTISFLGHVADNELIDLLAHCKAFIFPGYEDFGIAPLEAQASGRPVIAYKAGGALDTVLEDKTGVFFENASVESLSAVVQAFDADAYDPEACVANAKRFSVARFRSEMEKTVQDVIS
jgi:glycosyltransferase involved in cell wall biosynthesis